LESVPPVRRFSSYRGQRHLSGFRWWSATDGRHVGSESWLERDLMLLDFDSTVIAIGSQPFWLLAAVE
jgi:hypothetical protein